MLRRLLGELHQRGILTDDLAHPDDFDDLELVYRGLCRRNDQSPRRRIGEFFDETSPAQYHSPLILINVILDILTVPYQCRGAAMLYYTVSLCVLRRFH